MMTDAQYILIPVATPLVMSLATAGSVQTPVVDLLGQGVGTAPVGIIGNVALFGTDFGIGKQQLELIASVGAAFTTGNSATLTAQFQLAVDTGAAGGYLPGTWNTIIEQPGLTAAQLVANAIFARFDWPPVFPVTLRPRYMRLNFVALAATAFTAGSIGFAGVVLCRDDQANKYAAANYAVH
jgi:hypothetical protein